MITTYGLLIQVVSDKGLHIYNCLICQFMHTNGVKHIR